MSPNKRVLILGGGFGGLSAAHHLRSLLADGDEIVLVDRREWFVMGFHKNAVVAGRTTFEQVRRPLSAIADRGITLRTGTIDSIDPAACAAVVDGDRIEADAMVVALGAEVVPAAITGLERYGINIYSADGAVQARDALAELKAGRVLIGIFGAPYACPPAPFELSLLLADIAAERGAAWRISLFSPLPMSIPALGPSGCNPLEARLIEHGIEFRPNSKAASVEAGRVVFADGAGAMPFDLLLAVPPHRVPSLLVDAGLAAQGGWVKTDARTFETPVDGVYAIGDSTAVPLSNGTALPKAGAVADEEGRVVAARIAARLSGREPDAQFDGRGVCFLEVGGGEAMLVSGDFYQDPPQVTLGPPTAEGMAGKQRFEHERLDAWFGPA